MSRFPRVAAVALTASLLIPAGGLAASDASAEYMAADPLITEPTPTPWERLEIGPDGQSLSVYFSTGAAGCNGLARVEVDRSADVPVVTVWTGLHPDAAVRICEAGEFDYYTEVALDAPMVLDGSSPSDTSSAGDPTAISRLPRVAAVVLEPRPGSLVHGVPRNETVSADLEPTALGMTWDDVFVGTAKADDHSGGPGRDRMSGRGGDDTLSGWGARDQISGGAGADAIHGGAGGDVLVGGWGDDVIRGADGRDELVGGPGRDRLLGGDHNDVIKAQGGDADFIDCGDGDDTAYVDAEDTVTGCEKVIVQD
ncbi:MAG: calcium-binding protein [Candidatus Limnocylindrales bacterium]